MPAFPQLTLMDVIRPLGPLPSAAQSQLASDDWDHLLTFMARRGHPLIAWWWGSKRTEGGMVAWCYVCGQAITKAGPVSQMGLPTKRLIDEHRLTHIETMAETLAELRALEASHA